MQLMQAAKKLSTLLRLCAGSLCLWQAASAGVLPEDRADVLYHNYSGGGITIQGPSVLVRKKIGDSVSVSGNYYVDMISSASIDVVTQASPMCKSACYKEERRQGSVGVDYLHGKTTYSAGYIDSNEPDYKSKTGYLSVSQDMFGDLTTVSFGYTRGWDQVGERDHVNNVTNWVGNTDRANWQVGLSQVLTRKLLLGLNYETTESQGVLNNPYRSIRYVDASNGNGYSWDKEVYPHTRTGNAISAELKYYLPWRAALDGSYRFYSDTWGIQAHTARLGYTQPWKGWTFDGRLRFYTQTHATFYSDLFPYANAQNFMARDRELATFTNVTLGAGAAWQFKVARAPWIDKGTLNLSWDHLHIAYDDFRDVRVTTSSPGTEPLYVLDADVLQFFISIWY
ncbi:MAG: DUF3570 domain-containing protein [Steroidobacteraceae bacterium]